MPPLSKQTDQNTLNDFLTEAGELLERLDQDLVALEAQPQEPALLQGIFRAVHTIKGASSFMALEHLTALAHAAEDGLNALRQGQAQVTSATMDLLLAAVDALKGQFAQLRERQQPEPAPTELLTALRQIAPGNAHGGTLADAGAAPAAPADAPPPTALTLSDSKRDLLPFMAADLATSLDQVARLWAEVAPADAGRREALSGQLAELSDEMLRAVEFFEIPSLTAEVQSLHQAHQALPQVPAATLAAVIQTAGELVTLVRERAEGLSKGQMVHQERTALRQRLADLLAGRAVPPPEAPAARAAGAASAGGHADSTIRVEVARLEALLNLAGELVLQKNRVLALQRQVVAGAAGGISGGAEGGPAVGGDNRLSETFTQVASDLDRLTGDIQQAIMKTRLQPLDKLFSRYPRVVRDLGKATGKQIELVVQGADTEVDKTVLEALADPLVHLLRNCGDHGLELPEARVAAGKTPQGTITLAAQHQGHHVLIEVRDDGRGIDVARVGAKAVERGLVSAAELPTLSEAQVLQFIFAPGLSTAQAVSNLSGRGVGMDVVRTNLQKVGGLVDVSTKLGVGTTVSIRIPLTLAILPAMVVEVGPTRYALPLANILEIVRPEAQHLSTIAGQPVLRRREQVLPLVDLALEFGHAPAAGRGAGRMRFAVIAGLGERRVGLLVDRLVGQEEVVIKPLPEMPGTKRAGVHGDASGGAGGAGGRSEGRGAASGATIRADGTVSLILDLAGLLASLDARRRAA